MQAFLLYLLHGERNSSHPLKMGEFPCASFYEQYFQQRIHLDFYKVSQDTAQKAFAGSV